MPASSTTSLEGLAGAAGDSQGAATGTKEVVGRAWTAALVTVALICNLGEGESYGDAVAEACRDSGGALANIANRDAPLGTGHSCRHLSP